MDFLHDQLGAVERLLGFVKTEPIDWKLYVQLFSWAVTLVESYLLCVFFILFSIALHIDHARV